MGFLGLFFVLKIGRASYCSTQDYNLLFLLLLFFVQFALVYLCAFFQPFVSYFFFEQFILAEYMYYVPCLIFLSIGSS